MKRSLQRWIPKCLSRSLCKKADFLWWVWSNQMRYLKEHSHLLWWEKSEGRELPPYRPGEASSYVVNCLQRERHMLRIWKKSLCIEGGPWLISTKKTEVSILLWWSTILSLGVGGGEDREKIKPKIQLKSEYMKSRTRHWDIPNLASWSWAKCFGH